KQKIAGCSIFPSMRITPSSIEGYMCMSCRNVHTSEVWWVRTRYSALSFASFPVVIVEVDVIGDGVPRIVNSDNQQQERRCSNAKKVVICFGNNLVDGRSSQYRVSNEWK